MAAVEDVEIIIPEIWDLGLRDRVWGLGFRHADTHRCYHLLLFEFRVIPEEAALAQLPFVKLK
jgi:hypothetical protein